MQPRPLITLILTGSIINAFVRLCWRAAAAIALSQPSLDLCWWEQISFARRLIYYFVSSGIFPQPNAHRSPTLPPLSLLHCLNKSTLCHLATLFCLYSVSGKTQVKMWQCLKSKTINTEINRKKRIEFAGPIKKTNQLGKVLFSVVKLHWRLKMC